jgi:gas vesicle protein
MSFLCGMATGAFIGLLYAPRSGVRTRRRLARNARQAQRFFEKYGGGIRDEIGGRFERGRERLERSADRIYDVIASGRGVFQG